MPKSCKVFFKYLISGASYHIPHFLWTVFGEAFIYLPHDFCFIRILNHHISARCEYWLHIRQVRFDQARINGSSTNRTHGSTTLLYDFFALNQQNCGYSLDTTSL